ncbi:methyltransferase domain-containing protein [bacterium]|nr:methyltransferase domain-containing protein [bacterium]
MSLPEKKAQIDIRLLSEKTRKRYNRIAPVYDLMETIIEKIAFKKWRRSLWSQVLPGRILEIGVGTGKNIPHYPKNIEVTAIDISDKMMATARDKADKLSNQIDFKIMDVQSLSFPDDYFDAAVATFVFCSVPDPIRGLQELKRVVKPDSDIWLMDHVRIDRPFIGPVMDALNPIIVRIMGANINRRTVANVEGSGLKLIEIINLAGDLVKLIHVSPG